jgi:uncharacterized protein YkwD
MRKYFLLLVIVLLFPAFFMLHVNVEAYPSFAPDISTSYELLDSVNALRTGRGLPAYTSDPLLMGIAQTQAEYLATIGVSNTHIDAYGRRPYQRALDAGYMVAGDLNLGGWFSENVVGGVGLTADGAVNIWMGDADHQNTMLSAILKDAGAGVAVVGNTYYYVLDVGLSTGGTPVVYTPPPYVILNTPTIATNTPNPDGATVHIVQPGDTLLEIAIAYGITLGDLYNLNGLSERSVIYPDQHIIIRAAYTATPTQPTATATLHPSSTPWPSSTQIRQISTSTPTTVPTSLLLTKSAGGAVAGIIIAALLTAGIVTMIAAKKKTR